MMNAADLGLNAAKSTRHRSSLADLLHVYTGNVHDIDGDTTSSRCGDPLIVRDYYQILAVQARRQNSSVLSAQMAGTLRISREPSGRRRLPVAHHVAACKPARRSFDGSGTGVRVGDDGRRCNLRVRSQNSGCAIASAEPITTARQSVATHRKTGYPPSVA